MTARRSILIVVGSIGLFLVFAQQLPSLDQARILRSLESNYGERAKKRGQAWFGVMEADDLATDKAKLEKVNRFFNMFRFINDINLWGDKNYWASPVEFIGVNGGDCEDYSIAKYFTLLEMGVPDDKMRITMVKALTVNQYHMVLAYYETPGSIPLILDNLDGQIKLATKRKDLVPVYSFNGSQLWLNKEKGRGELSGSSDRIKQWRNLRQRIQSEKLRQPKLKMGF